MSGKEKVLVVSSEVTIANLLRMILESRGYHVISARDENEALAILQVDMANLVLLDMKNSESKVLKAIRGIQRLARVPLIALTGVESGGICLFCQTILGPGAS